MTTAKVDALILVAHAEVGNRCHKIVVRTPSRIREQSTGKIDLVQIRPLQPQVSQVSIAQACPRQISTAQISALQRLPSLVGSAEVSATQIGIGQDRGGSRDIL